LKKVLTLLALFLPLGLVAQTSKADIEYVSNVFSPATVLLYAQDEHGSLKMRCTATVIDKTDTGYEAVTASHCGCEENEDTRTVTPEKTSFYVTSDDDQDKDFFKAKIVGCGYRHAGDDFLLVTFNTTKNFPVVALGTDPKVMEVVVNVASPLGLGKQVFTGSVTSASLNRPVIDGDLNWEHVVTLQMFGTDGGSSGSAVVCLDQKAACAFIVGSANRSTITAMPVSRLINLRKAITTGKYKHWVENPDDATPIHKKDSDQ